MKLALHSGDGWNRAWKNICVQQNIMFQEVNCYSTDIIDTLVSSHITHLMWHFDHNKPKDILMARNVLYSMQKIGIKTFPDFDTCWHFDDKVAQKYLLESIQAPLVPSFVFYEKKEAINWLRNYSNYPIVAKLRRGAGSYNVKLIKSFQQAKRYCNLMFGSGVCPTPGYFADARNKLMVAGSYENIIKRLKKAPNYFKMISNGHKNFPKEKGYVYFQKFIPGNAFDIRIAVIGNKIWSFKRKVRLGDFRASGSGMIDYDTLNLPIDLIQTAYNVSLKLKTQSIAFDFVKDFEENYFIVEISYGYVGELIFNCKGYWNEDMQFIEGHFNPIAIILEDFINEG